METISKRIRQLIGENELEQAIVELEQYLEDKNQDLLDQLTLQRRNYTAYRKKVTAGYGDEREASAIGDQLMTILRDVEKWEKAGAQPARENLQYLENASKTTKVPSVNQPKYSAKCVFFNDPNQYFVSPQNQIVAVNAFTGVSMIVAAKMPSMYPNVAWVYTFPNGVYYNVDLQGGIWGMNAFGQPFQMGFVENLS